MNAVLLFFIGGLSSVFYFGGLWWTVWQLSSSQRPGILYGGSLILRLACIISVIWLVFQFADVVALGGFMAGFLTVRIFFVRHLAFSASP